MGTDIFQTFEEWWANVEAFADQYGMSYTHVEEEFIIDGEFVPVHLVSVDEIEVDL